MTGNKQNKWGGARENSSRRRCCPCGAARRHACRRQTWPSRTITLVVPFAAGGGTDAIGRVVAEKLAARLGQPVVVENKAGAASAIGTAYVAKAAADGYTLLMTTNSAMVILPLTQAGGLAQLRPQPTSRMIGLTGILPNLLIVSPKAPGQFRQRADRLRQGPAGTTVVRVERQRHDHASDRRTVQGAHRHRRGARPLPHRRAIGARRDGGPRAIHLRQHHLVAADDPRRAS